MGIAHYQVWGQGVKRGRIYFPNKNGNPVENAYDTRGRIVSEKNGLGNVTGYRHDGLG